MFIIKRCRILEGSGIDPVFRMSHYTVSFLEVSGIVTVIHSTEAKWSFVVTSDYSAPHKALNILLVGVTYPVA